MHSTKSCTLWQSLTAGMLHPAHGTDLGCADVAVAILVKHLEGLAKLLLRVRVLHSAAGTVLSTPYTD